jgi:hypothetical protein
MKKDITGLLIGEDLPQNEFEVLIKSFSGKIFSCSFPSLIELGEDFADFYVASELYKIEDVGEILKESFIDSGYFEISSKIKGDNKYLIVGKKDFYVGAIIKNQGRYSSVLPENVVKYNIDFSIID